MTKEEADALPWSTYTADTPLVIDYTNHAGKRATRRIVPEKRPIQLVQFPPEHRHADDADGAAQWALNGVCLDKKARRSFRLDYVHAVQRG